MMPLYAAKARGKDAVRIIEAPNNRAVLLHLAAEIFDVALVKIETIREDGDEAEPARRGRPRKETAPEPPEPAELASRGGDPSPPPADDPPPSEALIQAEVQRVNVRDPTGEGTALFERMSALARNNADGKEDGQ